MKNKIKNRQQNKKMREKLKQMMLNEDQSEFKEFAKKNISKEMFEMMMDVNRELRLNDLFENLEIDKNELEKAKKTIVKLSPKSAEWPLLSTLYRNHNGKYKVETLLNQYHDSTIRDGILIGIDYGKKFIVQDLQSQRFSKDDIINMSEDDVMEYCDENREEI